MSTIRVLQAFGRMNRGGAEMRMVDILRRCDLKRFKIDFSVLTPELGDLDGEIQALGCRIHPIKLNASFPLAFRRLLKEEKYDVVHVHLQNFSGLPLRLAKNAGTPVRMVHFRSTTGSERSGVRHVVQAAIMKRWVNVSATHILGNGEASLKYSWRDSWQKDSRCAVIHNGLDTAGFHSPVDPAEVRKEFGWPSDSKIIAHVGRMDPVKNHVRMLRIFDKLKSLDGRYRLLFAGRHTPEITPQVKAVLAETKLESLVAMPGVRNDVARLLKSSDLFLFPSIYEGLPGALLEACATGTPALASAIPGSEEVAARFPSVRLLSLKEDDAAWARLAHEILTQGRTQSWEDALVRFETGVYNIDLCVKAHELAWAGADGRAIELFYSGKTAND